MIQFHIPLQPAALPGKMHLGDAVCLIGSCFTEHMAARLRQYKFRVLDNPNGILFNPLSIASTVDRALEGRLYQPSDLFHHDGLWANWDFHSRLSDTTSEAACAAMNAAVLDLGRYLKNAHWLIITLGTAWVFELPQGPVVANCHKMPASNFSRRLLHTTEVTGALEPVMGKLLAMNPNLRVILTVSPVRHLRDGFVENNRSKAVLISAVHELVERSPATYYFPAYELVIDDLRDYRFFAEDMVHPNYQATGYVWDKFAPAAIADASREAMKEIDRLRSAVQHRPLHPHSTAHAQFRRKHLDIAVSLAQRFTQLDFREEISFFTDGGDSND